MIEANWLIFIAALIIGIIVAWWLFARGSKATVRDRRPDVLDEGAAPAKRNQALIDAPPAAAFTPPPMAGTMAGIGEIVSVTAKDEVAQAQPDDDLRKTAEAREEALEEAREEARLGTPDPLHKPSAVEAPVPETPPPSPEAPATPEAAPPVAEPTHAPAPELTPVSEAAPAVPTGPTGQAEDLRRIKGIGPKLATLLQQLGITSYAQIAGWTEADLDALDARLGAFAGRPRRDNWVEQAKLLSSGDTGAYEAKFGKL